MLVSIIFINMIINLISWYYYSCSDLKTVFQDRKFIRRAVWWT